MARILVVDDSSIIRDLLTDFLGELGHLVDSAVDGVEGLDKARSGRYDLCICDLHLPKKNGYQLLTELGSSKSKMQFIFTDSLPDGLFEQIQKTTDFVCLRKPFDLMQMREVIETTLEKAHVQ